MKKSGCDGDVQAKAKSHRPSRGAPPLSARACQPRTPSPQEIKDYLKPWQIEMICKDWLPDGRRQGSWWVCRSPWREDKNPSFGVSLTTGNWRDFATLERGDIFDLSMKLFNDSLPVTLREFAEMLGMISA